MLDTVFTTQNPFLIFGLVFLLISLGAFEAVFNRSKRRFDGMVRFNPVTEVPYVNRIVRAPRDSSSLRSIDFLVYGSGLMVVLNSPIQSFSCSLFSRPFRSPLRIITSPNMGTHKTYSNCGNASWKRYFWSSHRHESLFDAGCVRPLSLFPSIPVVSPFFLHRPRHLFHDLCTPDSFPSNLISQSSCWNLVPLSSYFGVGSEILMVVRIRGRLRFGWLSERIDGKSEEI